MKILIYGMGSMGKLFHDFFSKKGYFVKGYDIDERKREVSSFEEFDVIFLCIPMSKIGEAVEKLKAVNFKTKPLLVDISSVKKISHEFLKNSGFDFLSIHPMFGGDTEIGFSNILVIEKSGREEENVILEEFKKSGAILSKLSSEEHDNLMTKIQGISHFLLMAFSNFVRMNTDCLKYAPPIFGVLYRLAGRILNQDWETYYMIQKNAENVRETFLKETFDLHETLKDTATFRKFFEDLREIYSDKESSLLLECFKLTQDPGSIEQLRAYIKIVDLIILNMLKKRVDAAKKIAEFKAEVGEPIEKKELEEEKIREILSKTDLNPLRVRRIFEEIIDLAKDEEYAHLGISKKVAVLGPKGSFSEEVALRLINSRLPLIYYSTTDEIIKAVEMGEVDYGVVPIENSINGTVLPVLDALMTHNVEVFGEAVLEVNHSLVAKRKMELKEVRKVYSHPQAIAQCMGFINNYLPHAEIKYTSSTSDAATLLDDFSAAIMSENAAKIYGLQILRRNIQDLKDRNVTRFYVVRKIGGKKEGKITSLFFGVQDRPGALKDVLEVFYKKGFNLRKLESRPARTYLGDYIFFTEVEAAFSEEDLKELKNVTTFYKIVGVFDKIEKLHVG
ncbi:MAG: prephenate dehydratase [Archaeoglobaceae archaeon]